MRISFEPQRVTCIATKKANASDAVQVLFAAASDMGQADRMESDTSTITDQLEKGPYELMPNAEIDLLELPPLGRSNWKTVPLDFTESSNIRFTIAGVGLHKAELSGSDYGDLSGVQKLAMDIYKKVFKAILSKTSPIGEAVVSVWDFAEAVVNTGKNELCLGALFVYKLEYSGANLAFNLIKASGQTMRFELDPSVSVPVEVSSSCRQPAYSVSMVMRLHDKIDFALNTETIPRTKSQPAALTELVEECRTSDAVLIWVVKQDSVYRLTPTVEFGDLKYVWSINGQPLSTTNLQITLSVQVTRFIPGSLYETTSTTENVTIGYGVESRGPLRITCPSTSGNFRLELACDLHNNNGEKHRVYGLQWIDVESEFIDGNAAYHKYQECVHKFWHIFQMKFEALNEHLKTLPAKVPHFDVAPGLKQMTEVVNQVQTLMNEFKKVTKQTPGIR